MTTDPEKLKNVDLDEMDATVRAYLRENYLDHPTRGPYVRSGELYEALADELDDRVGREMFGRFCESRDYLEKWSRGLARYRIITDKIATE